MPQRFTPITACARCSSRSQPTPSSPVSEQWQDPSVLGRNKARAHATSLPYATLVGVRTWRAYSPPFPVDANLDSGGRP